MGKLTDNQIIELIFREPDKYNARDLMNLIENNEIILILDRGFDGFAKWLEVRLLIFKLELNYISNRKTSKNGQI